MRAPVSWLRELVALDETVTPFEIGQSLIRAGLEVEQVESAGADVTGPVVLGRVIDYVDEPQKNGKVIRWCHVDVGEHNDPETGNRGVVCGAHNFNTGDTVVVALPGAVLPGDFAISARKTYGHISDGMICSASELGLGDDHSGIMVLAEAGSEVLDDAGDPVPLGTDAAGVLHLRDEVLDIAVTPDLGYCFSIRGLARETAQAYRAGFTDPVDRDVPTATDAGFPVRSESEGCSLFVALTVDGVDPNRPSPRWMQRRLQLAGMRPISLAVDITNYVMLETGQPLHAYDADRLAGGIVVRNARAGETLVTLDDQTRTLAEHDLVITDDSGPIGLAGVMGGESTELREDTTRIVIEAAHFDPLTIARTSRRLKLSSEASRRFERGVDPNATYAAAHRVAQLLVELAGGTLSADETVFGAVPPMPTQTIDGQLPAAVLGTEVATDTVAEILTDSGVRVDRDGDRLTLTPPTWRFDLVDPYDYVEEIGCKIGLDTIEPTLPTPPAGRGFTPGQRARRAINQALPVAGFVEVLTFPFGSDDELDKLGVAADDPRRALVPIANPLSDVQPALRTTLLPGLFAAVNRNTSRSLDDVAIYESGSVFLARGRAAAPRPSVAARPSDEEVDALNTALPEQPRHLAAVLAGQWRRDGWTGEGEPVTWAHAVAFAETAAAAIGVTLGRRATQYAPWHPGRCAELLVGETSIGHAGEVHPTVCEAFGLPERTCAVELNLDLLIDHVPEPGSIPELSSFPQAKEDVALVVDRDIPVAAVQESLRAGAGELLEAIRLFDVYEGEQVPPGQRSLAFALRFRAFGRTLTDAEASTARDAAVARAGADHGAVLRS
ncbi:phenylalanine--tRNA ligase subunit beta [Enemella sp. A6]|uniref:phenylalanine--tRNA ligase subunit beta n=1 Tax=Enemella sp. A6 TaxID=3440152 RepID=UPI003EC140AE